MAELNYVYNLFILEIKSTAATTTNEWDSFFVLGTLFHNISEEKSQALGNML